MMNKEHKLEWRVAAYMAVWTVVAALAKWGFNNNFETQASVIGYSIIGVVCITFAVAFSYFEKHGNTPFLWFKTAPTKHWAMPGLGVFSNASSIAAIGIGFMSKSILQMVVLFVFTSTVMILQRRFVELHMDAKAKRILVGLIVPTIIAAVMSGVFFYNNAYEILVALV